MVHMKDKTTRSTQVMQVRIWSKVHYAGTKMTKRENMFDGLIVVKGKPNTHFHDAAQFLTAVKKIYHDGEAAEFEKQKEKTI